MLVASVYFRPKNKRIAETQIHQFKGTPFREVDNHDGHFNKHINIDFLPSR